MKAIRLPLAIFMALSLFLTPVASLAQAPTQEIVQSTPPTAGIMADIDWCVAGSMNGWDNTSNPMYDDGTNGDLLARDGIYSLEMSIATAPATYEWKAVECGNWGLAYPSANSWFTTSVADQTVTFTLDTNDYSANAGMALLPAGNIVNVTGDDLPTSFTAVGDFQGWDNANPATLMTDMGNGFHRLVHTIPLAGSYIGKVVITGSWDGFGADGRSTDAPTISFTTTEPNQDVVFLLDSFSGRMLIEPASIGTGTWCVASSLDLWATHNPLYDDGTNGDLLGGDGIFSADITIPTAERYEFKVTNCTWDLTYPSSNSWFITTGTDQVVKLTFDTNDHSADTGLEMFPSVNIVHAWDSANDFIAVGSFQGWDNANPETTMTSLGRGLYGVDALIEIPGDYEYKVVVFGLWDGIGFDNRSVNAANIPFTTYIANDEVPFLLDYRTGRVGVFPTPVPTEASHDNEVWWDYLGHDSRDAIYRTPGGPVTTGTDVILRLRAAQGDLTEAKLRLYNDRTNVQSILPMSIAHSDGTYDWWQATVPASADPTVYWYRFIAIDGTDTDYYEDDAARTMGVGEAFDETQDYSYQLTVYAPDFETPDWLKNAIVYQIFPDRFRDGDPTNNKPAGTFFYGEEGGTVYRSLTQDWNTYICDPRGTDDCAGTYSKNFYGGDLAGLTDKLDYLESLGVTTIYLNPIFASPSNHGYDTTDYLSINEMFGTQDDYNALLGGLADRGMHLIVDGVFNHVSSDSKYLDRYERYPEVGACESQNSDYRDWFYFTDVPAGSGPCVGSDGTPNAANYESWWGYDSLPKLNSSNPEVRAWIWDNQDNPETTVAGHWMLTADGWRLDVGGDVDPGTINDPNNDYWEGFRDTVKTVNPDGYITGEEWGIANSWLLGGEWDAVMNYQFSSAVLSLWRDTTFTDNDHNQGSSAGELTPLSMEQFDERILNLQERYAPEAFYAMMNLFGSHDTNRALFMLDENTNTLEPDDYLNPDYDWTPAIEKLKGAALVQMTMPGAPTIYYGDEVGLVGPVAKDGSGVWQDDPYNRQPYPWLDETGTPHYTHLQSSLAQAELYGYYATLTAARNEHVALRTGDYRTLLVDDENALYAYGRHVPVFGAAIVVINRGNSQQLVSLNVDGYLPYQTNLSDVLSTNTYTINTSGLVENIVVPANSGAVLVSSGSIAAPPEPVIDLAVTDTGADTVALAWSAATSANAYQVYRSYLSGGGYELVGETSNTTFTDTGLTPGQRVYYIVIAKSTIVGLLSGPSNEVTALPAYTIDWANLQWPYSTTHTIGINPTENIYGQVYIEGVTELPGATTGLLAQVGYGPNNSDPRGNPGWIWSDARYTANSANNDEFFGSLIPENVGEFDYLYRYTTDGGLTWVYAYIDGPIPDGTYDPTNAGDLTVTPSTDLTPPSTPVLSVADWSASSISLSWTAAIDNVEVYAYDIYRSTDNITFNKIGRVMEPNLTYTDTTVVTDQLYYYYIIALDTSFNPSLASNIVSQTAEAKLVYVTFEITVPDWTPGVVYIVGGHPVVGDWNPGAVPMTMVSDTMWAYSANILDGTSFEFKITRGNWETVMKGADGNEELANLPITVDYGMDGTQLYEYTVLNWRDPIVISTTPADGATDVPVDTSIVVTWSQAMATGACPAVWIEPNPADLIPVTCSFDTDSNEMTITPTESLPSLATIGVGLTGLGDAGGDTQQVSYPLFFTTEYVDPLPFKTYLPLISR